MGSRDFTAYIWSQAQISAMNPSFSTSILQFFYGNKFNKYLSWFIYLFFKDNFNL